MIEIVKASAGSGKTFTLAGKYIGILMESGDSHAYRHLLAVTFTNKATDEMKGRILKELHLLSVRPEQSPYLEALKKKAGSAAAVKKKAEELLVNLLHDYSAFAVSTIDSFFQRTLKAFAKEIGQVPSYQVEIDRTALIAETVDRLLDELDESRRTLLDWLTESVKDNLREKGRITMERDLLDAAEGIRSEEFSKLRKDSGPDGTAFYSKSHLARIRKACDDYADRYRTALAEAAAAVRDLFTAGGIDPADTLREFLEKTISRCLALKESRGEISAESYFLGLVAPVIEGNGDVGSWFSKSRKALCARVTPEMIAATGELHRLLDAPFRLYKTLEIIRPQTYRLGIVEEVDDTFQAVLRDRNAVSIGDTDEILHRIVSGTDAPFIYEKLGVRFEHFLLDEFQDTSVTQWENFRPLLAESRASGRDSLIVGDVKQSIYRFRGGDWKLLESLANEKLPDLICRKLDTNWRSAPRVVAFNNAFFTWAVPVCEEKLASLSAGFPKLREIYGDVIQQLPPAAQSLPEPLRGSVEITYTDAPLAAISASVRKIIGAGGRYSQIAVLVRRNDTGSLIAEALGKEGIPVISDDSLRVKASAAVRWLEALLRTVADRAGGRSGTSVGRCHAAGGEATGASGGVAGEANKAAGASDSATGEANKAAGGETAGADGGTMRDGRMQGTAEGTGERRHAAGGETGAGRMRTVADGAGKKTVSTFIAAELNITPPETYTSPADLCESLLRSLSVVHPETIKEETAYIEAFMDELKSWTENNGNHLDAFLDHWEELDPKLSSPVSTEAVTLLTIHKAKGLEFEYVIFPYIGEMKFFNKGTKWCIPKISEPEYAFIGEGAYRVSLSSGSKDTLFREEYEQEVFLQAVDLLNEGYVAFTRAKKGLHLISSPPSRTFKEKLRKAGAKFDPDVLIDFSQLLYLWLQSGEAEARTGIARVHGDLEGQGRPEEQSRPETPLENSPGGCPELNSGDSPENSSKDHPKEHTEDPLKGDSGNSLENSLESNPDNSPGIRPKEQDRPEGQDRPEATLENAPGGRPEVNSGDSPENSTKGRPEGQDHLERQDRPERQEHPEGKDRPEGQSRPDPADGPPSDGSPTPAEAAPSESERFLLGRLYPYGKIRAADDRYRREDCSYRSWPPNPVVTEDDGTVRTLSRLHLSSEAADFFAEDGRAGIEASRRLKGTVLHRVLSYVEIPSDLDSALLKVRTTGMMDETEAAEARALLQHAIDRVRPLGWFPEDRREVRTEAPLFTGDGQVLRPDRLLFRNGTATVIDYKFGEPEPRYRRQVTEYAALLQEMGYPQVHAYLWYPEHGEAGVEQVV